jgi:3'-phosphoadenosine 5'-phosphosulfate (PAPS) 3'-phosphatase
MVGLLDGTKESLYENGVFNMSIAFMNCHLPILGGVYDP